MITCPKCGANLRCQFISAIYSPYNYRSIVPCPKCKTTFQPKHWILFLLAIISSIFLIGNLFYWMATEFNISSQLLFILWIIYGLLSPLIYFIAEYAEW